MTVEEKALALVNGIAVAERKLPSYLVCDRRNDSRWEALCRAIEAREADKKAFSDAMLVVREYITGPSWDRGDYCEYIELAGGRRVRFADFILPEPEPDPLVEEIKKAAALIGQSITDVQAANITFYFAARGYKIERIEQ